MPILTADAAEGVLVLVLTRRVNESIMIGHEIVVTVLEVHGDHVRLGIKAPRSVDVHREEIFNELHDANTEAAAAADGQLPAVPAVGTGAPTLPE